MDDESEFGLRELTVAVFEEMADVGGDAGVVVRIAVNPKRGFEGL